MKQPTQIVVCRAYRGGWSWCDWYQSWGEPPERMQSVGWGAKPTVAEAVADASTQDKEVILTAEAQRHLDLEQNFVFGPAAEVS